MPKTSDNALPTACSSNALKHSRIRDFSKGRVRPLPALLSVTERRAHVSFVESQYTPSFQKILP